MVDSFHLLNSVLSLTRDSLDIVLDRKTRRTMCIHLLLSDWSIFSFQLLLALPRPFIGWLFDTWSRIALEPFHLYYKNAFVYDIKLTCLTKRIWANWFISLLSHAAIFLASNSDFVWEWSIKISYSLSLSLIRIAYRM